MKIKGKIVKGIGESKDFLSIPWVYKQILDTFRFTPYPGTLNIILDNDNIQKILKENGKDRLVHQAEGFCDALVFRGVINNNYECGVILPLVERYDEKLLEIVAPVHLKQSLHIDDGDEVTLELYID